MDSTDLLEQFRLDVVDTELPYLWSDPEVISYTDGAQKRFVREIGGIGDGSSALTLLSAGAGVDVVPLSALILKIRDAHFLNGDPIEIVNYEDLVVRKIRLDGRIGPPRFIITGVEPGKIQLYPVPVEDVAIRLIVDRLPLKAITDIDQKLEVEDQHLEGLLFWMKYRAYSKHDAETEDRQRSEQNRTDFFAYCARAKAEKDRVKHKTRIVAYGGI
jgi:hypothetical protein